MAAFLELERHVAKLLVARKERRRELLAEHYQPIFSDLVEIHRDYLRSVSTLRSAVKKRAETTELASLIRDHRAALAPERASTKVLVALFQEREAAMDEDERAFIGGVGDYIYESYAGCSAYTGLLRLLDDLRAAFEPASAASSPYFAPHEYFEQELERLEFGLEERFSQVSAVYNRLRQRLLGL